MSFVSLIVEIKRELKVADFYNLYFLALSGFFKRPMQLVVNHPFYFLIKSEVAVLMAGHIVNV